MSKIVRAVNAMISQSARISESIQGQHSREIFFQFDREYCWSILEMDDDIKLFFYPGKAALGDLARLPDEAFGLEDAAMVGYSAKDIGTKEAMKSFKELHMIVKEKLYGVSDALDAIIKTDEIPF